MTEEKNTKHRKHQEEPLESGDQTQEAGSEAEVMPLPLKEYASMLRERDDLRNQAKEALEGWQRERADFMNYKKRIDRDQLLQGQNLNADMIKKYLVVQDDLERALKMRPTEGEGATWAEGIELILRKLQRVLEAEGLMRIPAEGEMFDPSRHEAITSEDSPEHECGQIIEVVQQGYTIGDRVIRPALVRVAK